MTAASSKIRCIGSGARGDSATSGPLLARLSRVEARHAVSRGMVQDDRVIAAPKAPIGEPLPGRSTPQNRRPPSVDLRQG